MCSRASSVLCSLALFTHSRRSVSILISFYSFHLCMLGWSPYAITRVNTNLLQCYVFCEDILTPFSMFFLGHRCMSSFSSLPPGRSHCCAPYWSSSWWQGNCCPCREGQGEEVSKWLAYVNRGCSGCVGWTRTVFCLGGLNENH